jgi:hypothetical protein
MCHLRRSTCHSGRHPFDAGQSLTGIRPRFLLGKDFSECSHASGIGKGDSQSARDRPAASIYSTTKVQGWWNVRWAAAQPLPVLRASIAEMLSLLSAGTLTVPQSSIFPVEESLQVLRIADGQAGDQKFLLRFWISPVRLVRYERRSAH